jgi:MFS family permease
VIHRSQERQAVSASIEAEVAPSASSAGVAPLTGASYGYAMGLLTAISVVNYIDRQVVNIIAEPIKRELHLADWQIGLLTGLAFGLLYTFLGLPIARLAERKSRPLIIAVAAAVWSAFTVLSGLVQNFAQLALARVGVGVGEAGCVSPSHALIMDYAPREKRGSALALFGLSPQLGVVIGLAFGGVVADAYGWRTAFLVAGAPGLLFAVLAALTLPEPRRGLAARSAESRAPTPSLGDLFRLVAPKRSYWILGAAIILNVFVANGGSPFIVSFFLRNHAQEVAATADAAGRAFGVHLQSVGFLGLVMGAAMGLGGAFGTWCGGQITDKVRRHDPRRYVYGPAIAILLWTPTAAAVLTVPSLGLALGLLCLQGWLSGFWYGPAFAAWLSLVKPDMRATNSALILFASNLLGMGLGPLIVGFLSDAYGRTTGSGEGLRWALLTVTGLELATSALFWLSARTFARDQEA